MRRCSAVKSVMGLAILLIGWAIPADAQVTWTDATGFWEDPANWSSNPSVPGSGDNVVINVSGVQTVTHSAGDDTVASLAIGSAANPGNNMATTGGSLAVTGPYSSTGDTAISSGSVVLNGTSSLNTFTLSSGSLAGSGTVTISGAAAITFGDMRGPGTTILNGPTALSSSGLRLDSGRTLQNNATLTWTGVPSSSSTTSTPSLSPAWAPSSIPGSSFARATSLHHPGQAIRPRRRRFAAPLHNWTFGNAGVTLHQARFTT